MKKFDSKVEEITEALTSKVYHFTNIDNAIKIVHDNTFNLSTSILNRSESRIAKYNKSNKLFYMCVTRSKDCKNYLTNLTDDILVGFVLNGNKLNNILSSAPINYIKMTNNDNIYSSKTSSNIDDEMEDRIFSHKPELKPFLKYVDSIDIILNDNSLHDNISKIKRIENDTIKHNKDIKIKIYNNYKDYIHKKITNVDLSNTKPSYIPNNTDNELSTITNTYLEDLFSHKLTNIQDTITFRFNLVKSINKLRNTDHKTFMKFIQLMKKHKCIDIDDVFNFIFKHNEK